MAGPTFFELARSIDNELKGNFRCPDQTFVAGTYPVTNFLYTLLGNASAGNVNFNLATAVGRGGMRFTFKKIDGTTGRVVITANGLETIDGANFVECILPNEVFIIESDGANWVIVSHSIGGTTPGVASLDIAGIRKTDSDFSVLDPVPGTTIAFTTARDGTSFFATSGYVAGSSIFPSGTLAINVDGTDYILAANALQCGSGDDHVVNLSYAGSLPVDLTA